MPRSHKLRPAHGLYLYQAIAATLNSAILGFGQHLIHGFVDVPYDKGRLLHRVVVPSCEQIGLHRVPSHGLTLPSLLDDATSQKHLLHSLELAAT